MDNFKFYNDGHGGTLIIDPPMTEAETHSATIAHDPQPDSTVSHAAQVTETSGHDIISGPTDETFTGGAGHNTFVFAPGFGKDAITDFHLDTDVIQMNSALFSTAQAILTATHDDTNGNAVIGVGADTITLHNITTAQLIAHQNDFHII